MKPIERAGAPARPTPPLPVTIGWQGISLQVPAEWYLKGYTGDWREGYLQIGSPTSTEIDIKWVRSRRKTDLHYVLQQFLKRLEREKRKARHKFTGSIQTLSDHLLEFRWSADERGLGQIRRCEHCQTIALIQIRSSSKHEALYQIARPIFATLSDHPEEDGWVTWSLYGLHTALPARFRLEKAQVLTGQTRLIFRYRRERVLVERVARAEQLLKGYTFEEWVNGWLKWEAYPGIREPFEQDGDTGLHLSSRLGASALIAESLMSLPILHLPAYRVRMVAWLCPERNAVFHIQHRSPRRTDLLEEVMARTLCH
ncbi:MAG: hypothetical protein SNJ72_09535 [Fimbriimonadales bacterium]